MQGAIRYNKVFKKYTSLIQVHREKFLGVNSPHETVIGFLLILILIIRLSKNCLF